MFTAIDDDPPARLDAGRKIALILLGMVFGVMATGAGIWAVERDWGTQVKPIGVVRKPIARPLPPINPGALTVESHPKRSPANIATRISFIIFLVILPFVVPPIYSRRNKLSMIRWLLMAGFLLFVAPVADATIVSVVLLFSEQPSSDFPELFRWTSITTLVPATFGIAGCLLAAAITPKQRTG